MASEKKSKLKRVLIIIVAVILSFSAASMLATKLIYDMIFVRYDAPDREVPAALSQMVADREVVQYEADGVRLEGYLYRCNGENAKDALVVIAPGFHAGADDYLWQIQSLLDYGWSVFAYDPTGSCNSGGESYVGFPQQIIDMEATLGYLKSKHRFGYEKIALLGHSRGGYAAACALETDYEIDAVITVSGVNSAMEGIMGHASAYVGPVAYGNYGFLWLYQVMLFGTDTVNATADEAISGSDVPVLVVHGAQDDQFPVDKNSIISHSDEMQREGVEYVICETPGQDGHTDLLFSPDGGENTELMAQIHDFLERSIA